MNCRCIAVRPGEDANEACRRTVTSPLRRPPRRRAGPGYCGLCLQPVRACRCEPPPPLTEEDVVGFEAEGLPT